jgi:DNA repair protein RecO (recombination protein O)
VRGPKSRLAPLLQPFQPLLLSWSGRGEAGHLASAEAHGPPRALPAAHTMAGFYLNELLLKLTTRHDPQPAIFEHYHQALVELKAGGALEPVLRRFEKHLLEALGYGVSLREEASGRPVEAGFYYHFRPTEGLSRTVPAAPGAFAGESLLRLEAGELGSGRELEDARRLLRAVLDHCLEGRELATRAVARSISRGRERGAS